MFLGEVVGTAALILLGDGVVAGVLLNRSKAQNAGWIVITWAWGLAVLIGVITSVAAGGLAHLNPAVTLGLAVIGPSKFGYAWGDVPILIAGEFVGAFIGATLVYLAYLGHWPITEDKGLKLAVFSTGPAVRNYALNLITEIIGTFMLLLGVVALGTPATSGIGNITGLGVALLVVVIGMSLGGPTGYAINPARDLGPRIMHAVLPIPGKGESDWSYSWVPVVGPLIGGVLGAVVGKALFL
jgi:glycerol uptake facilitator protein